MYWPKSMTRIPLQCRRHELADTIPYTILRGEVMPRSVKDLNGQGLEPVQHRRDDAGGDRRVPDHPLDGPRPAVRHVRDEPDARLRPRLRQAALVGAPRSSARMPSEPEPTIRHSPPPTPFSNCTATWCYGWETGIRNQFRVLRRLGFTRAQMMEVVMFGRLVAGMRGLGHVYHAIGDVLPDYQDGHGNPSFPARLGGGPAGVQIRTGPLDARLHRPGPRQSD